MENDMSFLSFFGHFSFQVPIYNNLPEHKDPATFDGTKTKNEVVDICKCDPSDYFRLKFSDVKVTRIIYNDLTSSDEHEDNEYLINKDILLEGFLVDISPHLYRGRFFPL